MTEQEAISYIENQGWSTTRLGLERTQELLAALGDPQKKLKFVHVAGSNGKGSTCAMLDAILRAAGYRTGLYISPYIQEFCERMQVNGRNIPGGALAGITEQVKAIADAMEDHPSQFELATAIAMVWFLREQCDIVVLEVGMGGALDSTNVIDAPEVAVITNIGLEHTEYLGNTLAEIAATKAGIIKPGCDAVLYGQSREVEEVVERVCRERGVPLAIARPKKLEYRISLLGDYQVRNAAVVLETVDLLRRRGWAIPEEAVVRGLEQARWPGRMELARRKPDVILDGAHNPQCMEALAHSLRGMYPEKKLIFLTGVLADKDYPAMMEELLPLAREFFTLTPDSPRALPAEGLAKYLEEQGAKASPCGGVREGLDRALAAAGSEDAVCVCGSLYMIGEVRRRLGLC